jgi:hypothetical protein
MVCRVLTIAISSIGCKKLSAYAIDMYVSIYIDIYMIQMHSMVIVSNLVNHEHISAENESSCLDLVGLGPDTLSRSIHTSTFSGLRSTSAPPGAC